jgi:MYXO-CTERM domain-containing protein
MLCGALLTAALVLLAAPPAHAFDCTEPLPQGELVECDAENPATSRGWSGSAAGGGYIWHWGGGHRNYSGNAVVLYDTSEDEWTKATTNETWRSESQPKVGSAEGEFDSFLDDWTESEYGSDCYTPEEQQAIKDDYRSGNGAGDRTDRTLRGRPFVIHVYNARMYWPETGQFCVNAGGFWCYDPSKGDMGGMDQDCRYDPEDNVAWTRYTLDQPGQPKVHEPPDQSFESAAYSYDAELEGGSLVVFGGAGDERVKMSQNGRDWSFVPDGEGGDFNPGGSGAWGTTLTTYLESRGTHVVIQSASKGPSNDEWYLVDLVEKTSTEMTSALNAAGASSGRVTGLSYDPETDMLLAYGSFDSTPELWGYDMQEQTWTELDLGRAVPGYQSARQFDDLHYDKTTGRHYLLRSEGRGAPLRVFAFNLGDANELCGNDQDDDADGAVDCADPDCSTDMECHGDSDAGMPDSGVADAGTAPGTDAAVPADGSAVPEGGMVGGSGGCSCSAGQSRSVGPGLGLTLLLALGAWRHVRRRRPRG